MTLLAVCWGANPGSDGGGLGAASFSPSVHVLVKVREPFQ